MAEEAMKKIQLLDESEVTVIPEELCSAIIDPLVDINRVKEYFTDDAWEAVIQVVEQKKVNPQQLCPVCEKDTSEGVDELTQQQSILFCNSCLSWFHLNCLGKTYARKKSFWICRYCAK